MVGDITKDPGPQTPIADLIVMRRMRKKDILDQQKKNMLMNNRVGADQYSMGGSHGNTDTQDRNLSIPERDMEVDDDEDDPDDMPDNKVRNIVASDSKNEEDMERTLESENVASGGTNAYEDPSIIATSGRVTTRRQNRVSFAAAPSSSSTMMTDTMSGHDPSLDSRSRRYATPLRRRAFDILVSKVYVNAKLAKVKSELLNVLFSLPEDKLRWPRGASGSGDPSLNTSDNANSNNDVSMVIQDMMITSAAFVRSGGRIPTVPKPLQQPFQKQLVPSVVNNADDVKKKLLVDSSEGKLQHGTLIEGADHSQLDSFQALDSRNDDGNTTYVYGRDAGTSGAVPAPLPLAMDSSQKVLEAGQKIDASKFRRKRRKALLRGYVEAVQVAVTPEEVMKLIMLLEDLVPSYVLYNYPRLSLPLYGDSISSIAVRLYALDRYVRYEDLPLIKFNEVLNGSYYPRTKYSPRCILSVNCMKSLCHGGRCNNNMEGFSRYTEVIDGDLMHSNSDNDNPTSNSNSYNNLSTQSEYATGFPNSMSGDAFMGQDSANDGMLASGRSGLNPQCGKVISKPVNVTGDMSLDDVQPYVPKAEEVTTAEWV